MKHLTNIAFLAFFIIAIVPWLWLSQHWWTWALHPVLHLTCWALVGYLIVLVGWRMRCWTGGA